MLCWKSPQSATIAFVYIPLIYCCTSSFDLFVFLPSLEFLPAIGIVGVISWRSWCRISYNPFCERDLWLHCFYCGMVNLIQSLLTLSFVGWFVISREYTISRSCLSYFPKLQNTNCSMVHDRNLWLSCGLLFHLAVSQLTYSSFCKLP